MSDSKTAPEVLAMARRIAATCAENRNLPTFPDKFRSGKLDDHPAVIAALDAILETSERAAKVLPEMWADAIRNFNHIKD